jgi:DNA-directed RNA polymerase subunit RPC12/RpoP
MAVKKKCTFCKAVLHKRSDSGGKPYLYCERCKIAFDTKDLKPHKNCWCFGCGQTVAHDVVDLHLKCRVCGKEVSEKMSGKDEESNEKAKK